MSSSKVIKIVKIILRKKMKDDFIADYLVTYKPFKIFINNSENTAIMSIIPQFYHLKSFQLGFLPII